MNHATDADEDIARAKDRAAKQRVDQKVRCNAAAESVAKQKRDGVLYSRRARQVHTARSAPQFATKCVSPCVLS